MSVSLAGASQVFKTGQCINATTTGALRRCAKGSPQRLPLRCINRINPTPPFRLLSAALVILSLKPVAMISVFKVADGINPRTAGICAVVWFRLIVTPAVAAR